MDRWKTFAVSEGPMRQKRRTITKLTAICLVCSAVFSTGCDAQAFVLDILLPNIFSSSSSLLNPSTIIQSIANGLLGTAAQSSLATSTVTPTSTTTPTNTTNSPGLGTLGTTANQNGG